MEKITHGSELQQQRTLLLLLNNNCNQDRVVVRSARPIKGAMKDRDNSDCFIATTTTTTTTVSRPSEDQVKLFHKKKKMKSKKTFSQQQHQGALLLPLLPPPPPLPDIIIIPPFYSRIGAQGRASLADVEHSAGSDDEDNMLPYCYKKNKKVSLLLLPPPLSEKEAVDLLLSLGA